MASFTLSNLNLQLTSPLLPASVLLKIQSTDPKTRTPKIIKLPASSSSPTSISWSDPLLLPARLNHSFPFEILPNKTTSYTYNPEHPPVVLEGSIRVGKNEGEYSGWEVQMEGKNVGYLFANIQVYNKLGTKKNLSQLQSSSLFFGNTLALKKNTIAVTSIYAHFPKLDPSDKTRAFVEFELGAVVARSAIKRLTQNEYRSFQMMAIAHPDARANRMTVTGVLFDSHTNRAIRVGKGSTVLVLNSQEQGQEKRREQGQVQKSVLNDRVKVQRVYLYDQDEEEVGWISFKYLKAADECLDPRFFLQDKFNTVGDPNFKALPGSSFLTLSQLKTPKRMSGLQANSRIFIPKSNRFEDPAKRKLCERIGLGHSTIDIKQLPSTYKYRTPGMGYGPKHCSVERDRDIPGPGRYMTPTLFDSYRL